MSSGRRLPAATLSTLFLAMPTAAFRLGVNTGQPQTDRARVLIVLTCDHGRVFLLLCGPGINCSTVLPNVDSLLLEKVLLGWWLRKSRLFLER